MSSKNNISPLGSGSKENESLSEDKLMAYLEGKLSPAQQHDIELWLSEEGMESDALEGLHTLKPKDTLHTVNKLKHQLRKKIVNKKHNRRPLKTDQSIWVAVAIILLLAIVAYIVIRIAKP